MAETVLNFIFTIKNSRISPLFYMILGIKKVKKYNYNSRGEYLGENMPFNIIDNIVKKGIEI